MIVARFWKSEGQGYRFLPFCLLGLLGVACSGGPVAPGGEAVSADSIRR
jgi:hypothetical protein